MRDVRSAKADWEKKNKNKKVSCVKFRRHDFSAKRKKSCRTFPFFLLTRKITFSLKIEGIYITFITERKYTLVHARVLLKMRKIFCTLEFIASFFR